MKYRFLFLLLWVTFSAFSQQRDDAYIGVDYFYGSVLKHNRSVAQLVRANPAGVLLSYNKRTHGDQRWQQEYNYPDWGFSLLYQDFNNDELGRNYSAGFHYNFYFFNRQLQIRIGQGLNYNTNPFDIDNNAKNLAFGSHITGFSQIGFQYIRPRIIGKFGLRAGVLLLHHSNGGVKSPNSGLNTFATSIGITYDLEDEKIANKERVAYEKYTEPIKYNFILRGGFNESDFIELGQHPFFVASAFADKRLSYKHTVQLGVDFIVSDFLEVQREFTAAAFPGRNVNTDIDYKRVGLFLGHEFRLNRLAVPTQIAYYVYNPSGFEGLVYIRAGIKFYVTDKLFAVGTVRAHGGNAEAVEFGIGVRL